MSRCVPATCFLITHDRVKWTLGPRIGAAAILWLLGLVGLVAPATITTHYLRGNRVPRLRARRGGISGPALFRADIVR